MDPRYKAADPNSKYWQHSAWLMIKGGYALSLVFCMGQNSVIVYADNDQLTHLHSASAQRDERFEIHKQLLNENSVHTIQTNMYKNNWRRD